MNKPCSISVSPLGWDVGIVMQGELNEGTSVVGNVGDADISRAERGRTDASVSRYGMNKPLMFSYQF